ncbi:unnamed protein product [[Actinomadura] parvosata subsp. kistnae]|uniref:HTH cro/C1-type domain-containing protein n=1 Tax=[Actinomadura] parvosata subsp. kistnae TaxID=1909395 RepID=A0A1U9ZXU4_9ACTN|nr:helix-turn-helix transcriptional regulator [Nonomuraea sp. ATCC 55076]AQZ62773.1 hypothetical protein BKM31_16055 [Nonomuraea sp. ATCC 55076]SPL98287.1 unnamed protein product [Actinomadura parvosata subsp. kistnae]
MAATSTRGDDTTPYKAEGAFLKRKRLSLLNLTPPEVARRISTLTGGKFNRNTLDHWESGRRLPDDQHLVLLAVVYGNIDPAEIIEVFNRPFAAELLETAQSQGVETLLAPANPLSRPAPPEEANPIIQRQQRQIAQIRASKDFTDTQKERMIAALLRHYETTADMVDAQLGLDTST